MEIVRLELPGQKGVRPVRQNDGVFDSSGRCVGWITSCAGVGQSQFALAYVMRGCFERIAEMRGILSCEVAGAGAAGQKRTG